MTTEASTPVTPGSGSEAPAAPPQKPLPAVRLFITGVFMGLANLVPGVSGGTMVLALGLYDEFIGAVSNLTRLKFSFRAIIVLAALFGLSALTILVLSGVVHRLMEAFLPGMFALFIGMTLGGVPVLWKEMKPATGSAWAGAVAGFALMAVVAFGLSESYTTPSWLLLFIGGVIGSMAMILPGISGSYMLLVFGLYIPIIGGVSELAQALKAGNISEVWNIGITIILPVGLGVVVGVVSLSNILEYFLKNYKRPTIGFLLGLLVGSVLGLYPFKSHEFPKLPRYAASAAAADGVQELRIRSHGWHTSESSAIYRNLKKLENEKLRVIFVEGDATQMPTEQTVEAARADKSVIIAYDQNVPREVRRAANRKDESGKRVQLMILPNTEFTVVKLVLVLILMCVGFFITFFLGKLGGEEGSKA